MLRAATVYRRPGSVRRSPAGTDDRGDRGLGGRPLQFLRARRPVRSPASVRGRRRMSGSNRGGGAGLGGDGTCCSRAKRAPARRAALPDPRRHRPVSDGGARWRRPSTRSARSSCPTLGDFCMIDVIARAGSARAAVRVAARGRPAFERGLAERKPSLPERDGRRRRAAPRWSRASSTDDRRGPARALPRRGGPRVPAQPRHALGVTVALRARGEVTGALTLGVAWSRPPLPAEDARFAWILAGRVALALDNSGLFADLERAERGRAEIAETLQRGLLPPPLPHIPGWSVAAMYRPAGAENEVGGDFYDAFRDRRRLDAGDRRRHRPRRPGCLDHRPGPLHPAHRRRRSPGIPLVALRTLNRALLARGDASLCSVAAMALGEDPSGRCAWRSPAIRRRCWSTARR